jgi:cytochrome c peroxidase
MIMNAFQDRFWNSGETVALSANNAKAIQQFTHMEANFSLFWGLSIMVYEATLIPDDAPYDRYAAGNSSALTPRQQDGLDVYLGDGRCDQCHDNATFTVATNGGNDRAFANVGLRPDHEDQGRGEGMFKTPTLRNTELNGPYFHNGAYATLRQVVDFYNQGGNFDNKEKDSQIRDLGLSEYQKTALVDFLLSLTDERIRCEKAPFDHPQINIPNFGNLPAVGVNGRTVKQGCLKSFLNLNPFSP